MARCWMAVAILACASLWCAAAATVSEASGPVSEYRATAAMVIQLARFVEWPADTLAASREFEFCIAGDDRLIRQLETAADRESIGGRPARVRRLTKQGELQGCRVVVLGAGSDRRLADVTEPTLTISAETGFVDSGGMVELSVDRGTLSFQLNVKAAERARLRFSSRLLALASNIGRSKR